jgi:hypothetical protein
VCGDFITGDKLFLDLAFVKAVREKFKGEIFSLLFFFFGWPFEWLFIRLSHLGCASGSYRFAALRRCAFARLRAVA